MSLSLSTVGHATSGNLFAGYVPPFGLHDEMFAAPGVLRPHWQRFAADIGELGRQDLTRRWEQAQRLIHENGITYNAYGDARGRARPWELDPLPLLIPADQWREISTGLTQRARLWNLVLADLYGPQRLLSQGLLPAELVFAHPGFLRPYHGQRVPENCFLHFYAADLARLPDGRWRVVAERTEAPYGAGYALENRLVISRMLPSVFHDCQVERLAPFFIALRETMHGLAPQHRDNPRIVLLSQGPAATHYFEDAYLARYLGYTLVEGGDLAVHNNRVLLKTLGGLLPVDVILRRLDDEMCDPLELRPDSTSGVAGLFEAARNGNVVLANALGSGLMEAPAFAGFARTLCQGLLGEDLQLENVESWWCGNPDEREHVLANLQQLVVKAAFGGGREGLFTEELAARPPEALRAAILARPSHYVAQQRAVRSCAPVWIDGRLQAWHVALRVYLVAAGDSYRVMPGGLVRVSPTSGPLDLAITAGAGSKDAWVLSEGPVRNVSLLTSADKAVELRRSGAGLPSRVADNLYWLGRNVERAEGAARLLRTVLVRLTSESESALLPEMPVLLRALAHQGQIEPGFVVEGIRDQLPDIEQVLPYSVFDEKQPGSLRYTVASMYRVASIVRDRISIDSWRIINRLEQEFQPPPVVGGVDLSDVLARLNQMIIDLSAFSGLVMESMTRHLGWRFLDIGRRLERALNTIGLLQNSLVDPCESETAVYEAVLEVADSSMTYRSRYLANLQLAPLLDLLLTDETNPRSVAFQLVALADHVDNLPSDRSLARRSAEQRITLSMLNTLRLLDVEGLSKTKRGRARAHLDRVLIRLSMQLPKLSDTITHKYLIHAGAPRQLSEIRPE